MYMVAINSLTCVVVAVVVCIVELYTTVTIILVGFTREGAAGTVTT